MNALVDNRSTAEYPAPGLQSGSIFVVDEAALSTSTSCTPNSPYLELRLAHRLSNVRSRRSHRAHARRHADQWGWRLPLFSCLTPTCRTTRAAAGHASDVSWDRQNGVICAKKVRPRHGCSIELQSIQYALRCRSLRLAWLAN